MSDYQAVIFDMDGVIVNSEPLHESAFEHVVRELGYRNHGIRFADYIGRSDFELWQDFIARHNPPQQLPELLALKRNRLIEIMRKTQPIFGGVPELIQDLATRCPLAVASGSERMVIETVLSLRNMRQHFKTVVSSRDVQHGKPAPDIFLLAARQLGVAPEHCWVIEDSKPGVAAALAAGMRVIAITNTYPARELSHAHRVVGTYEEIAKVLLN